MSPNDRRHTGPLRASNRFGLATALALLAPGGHAATVILPVGDSITEGTSSFGFSASDYPESAWRLAPGGPPADLRSYREHLHDLLIAPRLRRRRRVGRRAAARPLACPRSTTATPAGTLPTSTSSTGRTSTACTRDGRSSPAGSRRSPPMS